MGLAIVMGAIAAAFMNIDKIAEFSGGGFSAKMREAINEAYATLDRVKKITEPLINLGIENLTLSGRQAASIGFGEKHRILEELSTSASEVGIDSSANYTNAINRFYRYHVWDFLHKIIREITKENLYIPGDLQSLMDWESTNYPTESQIIDIFNKHNHSVSPLMKEFIDDYVYYSKHNKSRRKIDRLN
jgi:hypothetical protein